MKSAIVMFMVSVSLICGTYGNNQIEWSTDNYKIYANDGTTLLPRGADDTVGYLVQLIYDSAGDGPDPIDLSNDYGVSDDDQFAAYSFIGFGTPPVQGDGIFNVAGEDAYINTKPNNSQYYIRAWQGVSKQSGTGYASTTAAYYGNSSVFTVKGNGSPPAKDLFFLTENMSTMEVVPEPATIALTLAGIVLLAFRRFRKKD
jgi:hypothetical protein